MSSKPVCANQPQHDIDYRQLEQAVADRVPAIVGPMFETNCPDLFDLYLRELPAEHQQHYNCHACRNFINRYGRLVTVYEDAQVVPVVWNNLMVDGIFNEAVVVLFHRVAQASITGVFVDHEPTWGTPATGEWTHLHGRRKVAFRHSTKLPHQVAADKKEDFGVLCRSLDEYGISVAREAVRVLESDTLYRSEKAIEIAKWYLAIHEKLTSQKWLKDERRSLIWLATANAPPGFCHVKTTMISTLMDDIKEGLPFEKIKARWSEKMHSLQYQRPTSISDGQLEQANKLVEKLGAEGSLARRYARLEEVTAIWKPGVTQQAEKPSGRPFDSLKSSKGDEVKPVDLPARKVTQAEFKCDVLPTASSIEIFAPVNTNMNFFALVTAADKGSPPLLQWDGLEGLPRNPVSWSFRYYGDIPENWNVQGWTKVNAVCDMPCHWQRPETFTNWKPNLFFILSLCRPLAPSEGGLFFPGMLRSEFAPIKAAMERYSNSRKVEGVNEATACGISTGPRPIQARVNGRDLYEVSGP